MKRLVFLSIIVFLFVRLSAQEATTLVKWYTIEEVQKEIKKKPKKVFVDVYTDWCHWCKVMDKNTFTHAEIAKYMNDNFYCVKFNAESKQDIVFNKKTYVNPNPGYNRSAHQLASYLTKGRLSYPTVVFLGDNLEVIQAVPGYQSPSKMEVLLNYFASDAYKTKDWDTFNSTFVGKIKE